MQKKIFSSSGKITLEDEWTRAKENTWPNIHTFLLDEHISTPCPPLPPSSTTQPSCATAVLSHHEGASMLSLSRREERWMHYDGSVLEDPNWHQFMVQNSCLLARSTLHVHFFFALSMHSIQAELFCLPTLVCPWFCMNICTCVCLLYMGICMWIVVSA